MEALLTTDLRARWRVLLRSFRRRNLRNNELALIAASLVLGVVVGIGVTSIAALVQRVHQLVFAIGPGEHLSGAAGLDWWRALAMPSLGGLLAGVATVLIRRWRPHEIVDAIEANALFGGKMSLIDSANVALLTLIASGFGASVGLEAAYTQLGAGLASRFGQAVRFRRADLRILVGCGAASAIAAAFNAPLAGAFYAFELVIGSYVPSALAPVGMAALAGTLVSREVFGGEPIFASDAQLQVTGIDYALFALVGALAAGLGVATMVAATRVERLVRRQGVPAWLRPAAGGIAVGMIAAIFPQVLGSGHGVVQVILEESLPWTILVGLIAAKALASAISIGAGFRGGLFSSSLLLGGVFGSAFAGVMNLALPALGFPGVALDRIAYTLVGMGSVAAAIVGGPLTMILLVLELTSSFLAALGVMAAVVIASFVVRQTFGYSFATWRFHLRGVPIRGGQDIGWLIDLSVGKLMRRDVHTAPLDITAGEFRTRHPVTGTKRVFLVDGEGRFAGTVATADVHAPDLDEQLGRPLAELIPLDPDAYLLPKQNVRVALLRFIDAETETLAVVSDPRERRIVGFVTEAYTLRRYNQELERSRAEDFGDRVLFGPE